MKKRFILLFAVLAISLFSLAACATAPPALDSVVQGFRDEGYTVTRMSPATLNTFFDAAEGFEASAGANITLESGHEHFETVYVTVIRFNSKSAAEEWYGGGENCCPGCSPSQTAQMSIQGLYVCRVYAFMSGHHPESIALRQAAIDLFNSFF